MDWINRYNKKDLKLIIGRVEIENLTHETSNYDHLNIFEILELQEMLASAEAQEDYDLCAKIRDQICYLRIIRSTQT